MHALPLALVCTLLPLTAPAPRVQPAVQSAAEFDPARTLTLDPVELCRGNEVEGDPSLAVTRDSYTYWFARPDSRDAFLESPETFEIQFNGACARMGPLSGSNDARRFGVHDGRIYLFASESCRQTFLRHADRLLERDDREPLPAECEGARGREALARAVEWMGGLERLKDVRTVVEHRSIPSADGSVAVEHATTLAIEFDAQGLSRAFTEDDWLQYGAWSEVLAADQAWQAARDGSDGPIERTPLVPPQRRCLERQLRRHPLVAIRAATLGDALVAHLGTQDEGGATLDRVLIHDRGASVTLLIEQATGRLAGMIYTARGGPSGFIGQRQVLFTAYADAGGLRLPGAATATFDGEPEPEANVQGLSVELNAAIDEARFDRGRN